MWKALWAYEISAWQAVVLLALIFSLVEIGRLRRAVKSNRGTAARLYRVLDGLYGGMFVGGCNWRYDAPPCGSARPVSEWCSPCLGRKTLEENRELLYVKREAK
jgi:hypothetical protein